MKQRYFSKYTTLIMTLLGLGLWGTIFFFPVNIDNQYTCLYHRLFSPEHSYPYSTAGADISQMRKEDLLHRYLSPFGLLWWGSLLITALSIYSLKRLASRNASKSPVDRPALRNHIET